MLSLSLIYTNSLKFSFLGGVGAGGGGGESVGGGGASITNRHVFMQLLRNLV